MKQLLPISLLASMMSPGFATVFQEMEPNNTPQTANVISGIQHGDMIRGRVEVDITNPDLPIAENDYFSITMGQTDRGLYRNEIWMNENMHVFITEGLRQTNHEIPYLLASRWYSFTGAQPLSFGVSASYTGSPHNYADDNGYRLSYRRARVPESDLGQFQPGMFRLLEINPGFPLGNRMDVLVLDSNGRIVPGGLNQNPSNSVPCDISVTLEPGDFYVLFAPRRVRAETNRPGSSDPTMSPGNFEIGRRESILDSYQDVSFEVTTPTGVLINRPVGAEYFGSGQDLVLYKMTVVPDPASALILGAGVLGATLRRRSLMRYKQ